MANPEYLKALFSAFPADLRKVMNQAAEYILGRNLRLGVPEHQEPSENFQAYFLESTTAATANSEFSIPHGMGRTPYLAVPMLNLQLRGATLPELTVSRTADDQRVYLSSPSTGAIFTLLVE